MKNPWHVFTHRKWKILPDLGRLFTLALWDTTTEYAHRVQMACSVMAFLLWDTVICLPQTDRHPHLVDGLSRKKRSRFSGVKAGKGKILLNHRFFLWGCLSASHLCFEDSIRLLVVLFFTQSSFLWDAIRSCKSYVSVLWPELDDISLIVLHKIDLSSLNIAGSTTALVTFKQISAKTHIVCSPSEH